MRPAPYLTGEGVPLKSITIDSLFNDKTTDMSQGETLSTDWSYPNKGQEAWMVKSSRNECGRFSCFGMRQTARVGALVSNDSAIIPNNPWVSALWLGARKKNVLRPPCIAANVQSSAPNGMSPVFVEVHSSKPGEKFMESEKPWVCRANSWMGDQCEGDTSVKVAGEKPLATDHPKILESR